MANGEPNGSVGSVPVNPWDVGGKEFKDWTTTEALDLARHFQETMLADPSIQGLTREILLPLMDWALDVIEEYNAKVGDDVTLEEVARVFLCSGIPLDPDFLRDFLLGLWFYRERRYSEIKPCVIAAMAQLGACFLRDGKQWAFAPDLLEFWLYGKGNDPANLQHETVSLVRPDGGTFGRELAYHPVAESFLMPRIGELVYRALEEQYLVVLGAVCERLHAASGTQFPRATQAFLTTENNTSWEIVVQPDRNALLEDGRQVLYSEVSLPQDSRVDPEFYTLGLSALLSEIDVRAASTKWTDPESGVERSAWEVRFDHWRTRFWDIYDFEPGTVLYVPLPSGDEAVPDAVFERLKAGWDCGKGLVTPASFLLLSDTWMEVDVARFGTPGVIVVEGSDCDFLHGAGVFHPAP